MYLTILLYRRKRQKVDCFFRFRLERGGLQVWYHLHFQMSAFLTCINVPDVSVVSWPHPQHAQRL